MASVGEPSASKRPHIKTERMQEFMKSHADLSSQKQFKCPIEGCSKVLTTQPGLRYHIKTHETGQDPVEFKCLHCFRKFKSSNGLKYHRGKTRCEDGPASNAGQKADGQDELPTNTEIQVAKDQEIEEDVRVTENDDITEVCVVSDAADVKQKTETIPLEKIDNKGATERQDLRKKHQKKVPPKLDFVLKDDTPTSAQQHIEVMVTSEETLCQGHTENHNDFTNPETLADNLLCNRSGGHFTELKPVLPSRPCYQYHNDNLDRKLTEDAGKLTEFAHFATSPQSPLMQTIMPWDKPTGPAVRCLNKSLDTCPPDQYKDCNYLYESVTMETTDNMNQNYHGLDLKAEDNRYNIRTNANEECESDCMTDTNGNYFIDGSDPRVTSSSPFPVSPKDQSNPDGTWSHKWPTAIWQCFVADTQICFVSEMEGVWQSVESLAKKENLAQQATRQSKVQRYAENGLRLLEIHCYPDGHSPSIRLFFTPDLPGQSDLWAHCELDHPFYAKEKGWCSFNEMMTAERYGIPCNKLEVGDVCLGPKHPESFDEPFSNMSSDTSSYEAAVYTLSSMAQQRNQRDHESSPKNNSQSSPSRKRQLKPEPLKAKRPMNAFMLFAKENRLEYTQKFPGKDNRAISVMLGDKWKKMNTDDRNVYAEKAKVLADQQKKMHPDCWKRKK